jgi:CubicO group peptidase (beta-lactamase class C family)
MKRVRFRSPRLIATNTQPPESYITKQTRIDLINSATALKNQCKYRYSALVFIMLGRVLEFIYNKPYDTIIAKKIIEPLLLVRTLIKTFDLKSHTAIG